MAVIRNGVAVEDRWLRLDDETDLPAAGDIVVTGEWVTIAVHSIADGEEGYLTCGVIADIPKNTGGSTDFAVGVPLWWDAGNGYVSETESTFKLAGRAIKAATTADATCRVRLNGPDYNTDVS